MIELYVYLIHAGLKTIENIPAKHRKEVEEKL